MKKITILIATMLMAALVFAQNQEAFKYQAVIRNLEGQVIASQKISFRINILENFESTSAIFTETHQATTNAFGLLTLEIGNGATEIGRFSTIEWSKGYFIQIEMDETGGTNYQLMGTSKILSVPYALYAKEAENTFSGDYNDLENKPIYNSAFINDAGYLTQADLIKVNNANGNGNGNGNGPGVPSQTWSLFGNSNSDPEKDQLGTTDSVDFVMVTNNEERLRIQANGDIDIANSLEIGEDLTVKQNVFLNTEGGSTTNYGAFTVEDASPTTLSGILTVEGASTLNNTLDVSGATTLENTLDVAGATTLDNTLDVAGITTVSNTTASTDATNGALVVTGGAGIGQDLNVGGDLHTDGNLGVDGTLTVKTEGTLNGNHVAHFENNNNANGISIQVNTGTPSNANNYITFYKNNGVIAGRIEGETNADLGNNRAYQSNIKRLDRSIGTTSALVGIAAAELVQAGVELTAASTSSTGCAGLGFCITAPIPSLIVSAGAKIVLKTANLATRSTQLGFFVDDKNQFISNYAAKLGITYASGSADYAEYLPKLDPNEKFAPGEIVGLTNGFISKNTAGASQIMVISHKPAMLGGLPAEGEEWKYEKVAFLGQVPTRIYGAVNPGDYILPSGFHNGFGVARAPERMRPEDYKKVLGVSWGTSIDMPDYVNVAVGLNANDLADAVIKQEQQLLVQQENLAAVKTQLAETHAILAELLPGFKEAAAGEFEYEVGAPLVHADDHVNVAVATEMVVPTEEDIVYYEPTKEEYIAMIEMAKKIHLEAGGSIEKHSFWNRITTDPAYFEEIVRDLEWNFQNAVHFHKEVNKGSGK